MTAAVQEQETMLTGFFQNSGIKDLYSEIEQLNPFEKFGTQSECTKEFDFQGNKLTMNFCDVAEVTDPIFIFVFFILLLISVQSIVLERPQG
jgi:hypothetical protein